MDVSGWYHAKWNESEGKGWHNDITKTEWPQPHAGYKKKTRVGE